MTKPIAILCSDIHLSERPPAARAAEPDWFEAMARPLRQIKDLAVKNGGVPVVVAGDIFDRWNASPAVINFAIEELPHIYAVPGQHDLPNHNYQEITRSAYWTLVEAGKITDLDSCCHAPGLVMYGFPWGREIKPLVQDKLDGRVHLAVIHRYVHTELTGYGAAPYEQKLMHTLPKLAGYDAAVFGDNHKGFLNSGVNVINCGTMMRRKQDERQYRPQIGILYDDGLIERHLLDVSQDVFCDADGPHMVMLDSAEFLEDLKSLGPDSLDFRESIMRALEKNDTLPAVRKAVLEAMEG